MQVILEAGQMVVGSYVLGLPVPCIAFRQRAGPGAWLPRRGKVFGLAKGEKGGASGQNGPLEKGSPAAAFIGARGFHVSFLHHIGITMWLM
jgi:hypothetical protein